MLYCIKTTLQCSRIPKLHTLKGHLTPLIRQVNATSFSPLQQKTPSKCQASVAYRMIVRYFIRQLRFLLESGEVEVYFWPNPAEDKDRRRLIEKEKRAVIHPLCFLVVPEAGLEPARARARLILSQVRLPIPPLRRNMYSSTAAWSLQDVKAVGKN